MAITINGSGITSSEIADGTITASDIASGVTGKVLQVVSAAKNDTWSTNSQSFVDITGLSISITPTAASSKILVIVDLKGTGHSHASVRLLRDGTTIGAGASTGNRTPTILQFADVTSNNDNSHHRIHSGSATVLDSPSTTAPVTYKLQGAVPWSTSYILYVNRSIIDVNAGYEGRTASSITLMEIGA